MNKLGDKRIKNDDFQQFEKCYGCGKGFWATSYLEIGNWETHCKPCQKKADLAYKKKHAKEIKEKEIFLKSLTPEIEKLAIDIDDVIRQKKRELLIKKSVNNDLPMEMKWSENEFNAIKYIAFVHGYFIPGKVMRYMGVEHSVV